MPGEDFEVEWIKKKRAEESRNTVVKEYWKGRSWSEQKEYYNDLERENRRHNREETARNCMLGGMSYEKAHETARKQERELDRIYDGSNSSGCFIATAVYGTPMCPEIDILRKFRDTKLLDNIFGETFVKCYYKTSPPIADIISKTEDLRKMIRTLMVKPLVDITNKLLEN